MPRRISLVVAAAVLLAGCNKPAEEKDKTPVPVQVTAVTQATIRRIVEGEGALYPLDQASIMPKVSAPVQKFYVQRGDHVVDAEHRLEQRQGRERAPAFG